VTLIDQLAEYFAAFDSVMLMADLCRPVADTEAGRGIQIGGIGSLAPERRGDLSQVAFKAMIGGALASWLTATVAGIML